ncbi:MAG: hypothetical protein QOJ02_969 [Acidobacteriota bacterium]|jgi:hypothetical protein|nr:hypothetical protein [Acidobacteriota bacterium]
MRYYSLFVGLLIATCCLFFPYQVNATPNTYTYSTIDFDDSTGTILATGHTQADYQTGAYYQYTGAGLAIKDADGNMLTNQQSQVRGLTVDVSAQTDAYADQEYTVQTGHYILATYYLYNYYYQGQYVSGYSDPYNYSYYEGQQMNNYYEYYFYGNGPQVISQYTNDIILGQTKKKVKVGTPHHLKIVSDTRPPTDCGSVRRLIKFQVVDINGRRVGHSDTEETFEDLNNPAIKYSSIYNSCQNSNYSPPACSRDIDGSFTDQLWVGCPSNGGDCGFPEVRSVWSWCPANRSAVVLSRNDYYIRHSVVFVNGIQEYAPGVELYP